MYLNPEHIRLIGERHGESVAFRCGPVDGEIRKYYGLNGYKTPTTKEIATLLQQAGYTARSEPAQVVIVPREGEEQTIPALEGWTLLDVTPRKVASI